MSAHVVAASLFLVHLYLEPVSNVPLLVQTISESLFSIQDILSALILLLQTVKVESPDRIQITPSDPVDKSAFSQRLLQLWKDKELAGNSLFVRLKNGIMLGVRDEQLLDFWLYDKPPELSAIPDCSSQEKSASESLWQSMAANRSSPSDFLSILFSAQTVVGSSINVSDFRGWLCRFCCAVWLSVSLQIRFSFLRSPISIHPIRTVSTIRSSFLFSNGWLPHKRRC